MQHKNEDYALKTTCLCINDQLPQHIGLASLSELSSSDLLFWTLPG